MTPSKEERDKKAAAHAALVQLQQSKLAEDAAKSLRTLAEHCVTHYLLSTNLKQVVLVDNVAAAKLAGVPFPPNGELYSFKTTKDAKDFYSNVPFIQEDPLTGKYVQRNVSSAWLQCPKRIDLSGVTFSPGSQSRIISGKFNINRGLAIEPVESDAADPFWTIVHDVLCDSNEEYFEFVLKWLAHLVQRPEQQPLCAIGIYSQQGMGKSLFTDLIGSLFDSSHYNGNVPIEALIGTAQGRDVEGKLLVAIDDTSWGGNPAEVGALKKAITHPFDRINEKYVPVYSVPSYKRIIFSSNNPYYYHADKDDRRLLPLEVPKDKWTKAQIQELVTQLNLPGTTTIRLDVRQAVLHRLQSIDIDGWVPHIALRELNIVTGEAMIEQSMNSVERWLKYSLENRCFELEVTDEETRIKHVTTHNGKRIPIPKVRESYAYYCSQSSFDRSRKENLGQHTHVHQLRAVFGDSKHFGIKSENGDTSFRAYEVDWDDARRRFKSQFRWTFHFTNEDMTP